MIRGSIVLVAVIVAGCASPPPASPPVPSPVVADAPTPPPSDASQRAQALIDDLHRRQAAQAQFDRENPAPPPPRIEDYIQPSAAPAQPTLTAATPTPAPAAPTTPAPAVAATDARVEQWWKEQARTLQVALEEETSRMHQAGRAMQNSTLKITADEAEREYRARVAAVQNARAALDRLADDARRAGVPAGWARWP